jgi:DNA polymerase-3 subunit delta'
MLFSELIGQKATHQQLLQAVHENRMSHAMLFLAPEGTGGLPAALAFTQYLVCENRTEQDSCGTCAACQKAKTFQHPDIHFSYPVVPKKPGDKPVSTDYIANWREFLAQQPYGNAYDWLQSISAENKQGNITAHECQDIIRKLNLKSFESGYKILLMWMPEYLGNEGNRLLKLIEEPPAQTVFILVAEQQDKILATILSRTQLVKFQPLSREELVQALQVRNQVPEAQARQISTIAGGNYREALHLVQHNDQDYYDMMRTWLNTLFTYNRTGLYQWVDQISNAKFGRENQKQFLRYFVNVLEHSVRLQFLDREQLGFSQDEADFAAKLHKLANLQQLEQIIQAVNDAYYHIERNANAKLLFHGLSIRMQYIFKDLPLPV